VLPQAFLAADAILELAADVASGLVVYPKVIAKNLAAELPFMAVENVLMAAVAAGGDRQELHERLRRHAQAAGDRVKRDGAENDLLDRVRADPAFRMVREGLGAVLAPGRYVGRAPEQVDAFVKTVIAPIRRRYRGAKAAGAVRV